MGTILNLLIIGGVCVAIIAIFLMQSSAGDASQSARVAGRGRARVKPTFTPPPPITRARRRLRWDQPPPHHMPPPASRPSARRLYHS